MIFQRFFPWFSLLALVFVSAVPLLVARHLPLGDYPNHLARMHILSNHGTDGFLNKAYELSLAPRPNLGMDVVVFVVSNFLPGETASRLFVAFSMIVTLSGVVVLSRVIHREWSPISLMLGAIMLYNWVFAYGFMNFLFSLGLMLWALAAWIVMLDRSALVRVMAGMLFAAAIFLARIVPFVVFALALGGIGLHHAVIQRRVDCRRLAKESLLAVTACGLPALVFLNLIPASGDLVAGFSTGSWSSKLVALIRTPLGMNLQGDVAIFTGVLVLLVSGSLWGKIAINPMLRLVLALVGLAFVIAPYSSQLGYYLTERIYLIFLFLLAAALKITFSSILVHRVIIGILAISISVRSLVTANDWSKCDESLNPVRDAFSSLEGPAILYVAAFPDSVNLGGMVSRLNSRYRFFNPAELHIGAYAALNNRIFVPMVYAHPSLQPIRISERFAELAKIQEFNPIQLGTEYELIELIARLQRSSVVLPEPIQRVYLYVQEVTKAGFALDGVTLVAEGPGFVIYRLL